MDPENGQTGIEPTQEAALNGANSVESLAQNLIPTEKPNEPKDLDIKKEVVSTTEGKVKIPVYNLRDGYLFQLNNKLNELILLQHQINDTPNTKYHETAYNQAQGKISNLKVLINADLSSLSNFEVE